MVNDDAQGDDEIELNDEVDSVMVEYACVHTGKTDVSIINLLLSISVSFCSRR